MTQRDKPPVLFCLPFAGGGASAFATWQRRLGASIEVRPLQLPGRESLFQLDPLDAMEPLMEFLLPQVLACRRPFAFFGHSLGALISYELCRRLEAADMVPQLLIVSARMAPHRSKGLRLHNLPTDALIRHLRDFGGTPERVLENEPLMRAILPIVRADLRVAETYQAPQHLQLRCPIIACGARDDSLAPLDSLGSWAECTQAGFKLAEFSGGHFFLRTDQERLLALLQDALSLVGSDIASAPT